LEIIEIQGYKSEGKKMELPITRPSMMSYADQLDFNELLGKLKSDKCNGFIRVTSGSLEGHILFKNGNQVGASFDRYSKIEAIEKIRNITDDANALIEVFDLKESQLDYLMNVNKPYLINLNSKADDIRQDIVKSKPPEVETKPIKDEPEVKSEDKIETSKSIKDVINEVKSTEIKNKEPGEKKEETIETPVEAEVNKPNEGSEVSEDIIEKESSETPVIDEEEGKIPVIEEKIDTAPVGKTPKVNISEDTLNEENSLSEDIEFKGPGAESESIDRSEIMKKYGLKDVHEEEVENLLESYKGGSLSAEDVEKIELTLMNKIKKSILGIPKIKGAEVIVFLDNSAELLGTINIITEYESKGILSRIMGDSKDTDNLKIQIINLTEIEIRKSFRGYPEIVDNFEINVEFS